MLAGYLGYDCAACDTGFFLYNGNCIKTFKGSLLLGTGLGAASASAGLLVGVGAVAIIAIVVVVVLMA